MTYSQSRDIVLLAAIVLFALPLVDGSLIRFEHGYSYQYQYNANVTLDQVDTFQSTAKVFIKTIEDMDDEFELLLEVEDFKFQLTDRPATHDHRPDFSKWFSFVISNEGEIEDIFHHVDEDTEILTVKKAIAGLLAGTYLDRDKIDEGFKDDAWSYTATELGHEGKHNSMYRVVPNSSGKTFTKTRVLYKHPVPHAESTLEKITYIDDNLGTIHSASISENMTASHASKTGFDPYYAMRKVDAINEFKQLRYPDLKAFSIGKLRFIRRKIDNRELKRPTDVKLGQLHLSYENHRQSRFRIEDDVRQYGAYIHSNLTCMRRKEEGADLTNRLDCFHNIVNIMSVMPEKNLRNVTLFYLGESNEENLRIVADQNVILDALGAMGTNISQTLLTKYIFQRNPPDDAMMQRALVHIATMQDAPNQKILAFLQAALEDSTQLCSKFHLTTYHGILLTIGSVANKLTKAGQNDTAGRLTSKLHDMLGLHDPWKYRERRDIMTDEEQIQYDKHHVILLEALGNGCHEDSYEYILSHLNATNSPWIKRAGIHALRKYHHSKAAETLLNIALNDDNEEVRYEALLQYRSHPESPKEQAKYTRDNQSLSDLSEQVVEGQEKLSRHKRGIFDQRLEFKLAAPGVDFQKRIGSADIGASFGVIMQNFLQLQVSPLSGLFRVVVHDEVYARVHLGFLGLNYDFFSARICFKGGTSYSVNILQEFDPRLNPETIELVTKSLSSIVDGIRKGIDIMTSIIDGLSGELSLKTIVDDFLSAFRNLPNQIFNLRSTAVKMARELGELIVDQLPPFIQPVKNLVEYASNLLNSVKSDFMEFYNSVVQVVETTIPTAAETLYSSAKSIIETFPTIFKDPKTAVARIGKAVTRIAVTIQQLKRTKEKIEESVSLKVLPFWTSIGSEYEKLTEMVESAYNAIKNKGTGWIDDIIDGEDPVAVATDRKMTTADIRRRVVQNLQGIIDDLYQPFASLRNLGQLYLEKFSQLFSLISNFKMAYDKLKTGYKEARTVIETIFGPKCHTEFPRLLRLSDDSCSGDGFFPSHLGSVNTEYENKGIDIVIDSGSPVVSPFSGTVMRTNNNNEVKLVNMTEMITGSEVIITNIQPVEDIYPSSDKYYIKKQVAAGDNIGNAIQSLCGSSNNHIHFVVLKNGEPIDPTRFLQPRRPHPPKWEQICDDYKVVYKAETIAAGAIVGNGGRNEDTSGHLPDDGATPNSLDTDTEPKYDHDSGGMHEKLRQAKRRKKRGILDTAKSMIDTLVERTEAFLEQFSISRITMGNIASFVKLLELENTKNKMIKTLTTIKNVINNKACKAPDAMTNDELQTELAIRGLTATGGRKDMIAILSSADERCPLVAMAIPELGPLYCTVDPGCFGIQCCLSLRVAELIQVSYQAYVVFDIEEMSLSIGFENWKKVWSLDLSELVIEDAIRTGIKFELLDLEVLCRYRLQINEHEIILTFGAGLCSSEDMDICLVDVNMMEDVIFPLPVILGNGSIVMQKVDWENYINLETVASKFKEAGQDIVIQSTDTVVDELISFLDIPKELLQNNPRCLIPENLPEQDLYAALRDKDLSTDGSRTELEKRLHIADRTCYPTDGHTVTFPEIENDVIRRLFYYFVSKDCLRIEACLDASVEELGITKTFSAFIELLPCNFQVNLGIEKWRKTVFLIDYDWGTVKKAKLTESVYLSFMLDKLGDTNEFLLDAELVLENFNYNIMFIRSMKIPIPGCNGTFQVPGKGTLLSLAQTLGGELSEDAFKMFLSSIGIEDIISDQQCVLRMESTDCETNVDDYIPDSLKSILNCKLLDNCWGLQCCIEFSFDIPLSTKSVLMSMPFMFRYDPCEYFVAFSVGQHKFKEWFLEYNWGTQKNITIGNRAPITLSYDVKKFGEGFTVDVQLFICIPVGDGETLCIPNDDAMHLIENEYIPECLHKLDFLEGIPDFSLTEWLYERGKEIGDEFGEAGKDYLIEKFQLNDLLLIQSCDRKRHPFSPAVNGWNIACDKSLIKIPALPDFLACHIDETCSHIVCCVDVDVIGLSLKFDLDLDLCRNSISAGFENIMQTVDNALSKYEWGKEKTISLGKVLNVRYKIQKPGRNTYVVYAQVSVCFERNGDCFLNTTIFDGMEIPRRVCTSTNETCMVLVEDIKHQCAMDIDCVGITCDVLPETKTDLPGIPVSYRIDSCMREIIIEVENRKWERSLSSVLMGETISHSVSEHLGLSFTLDESAVQYRVALNLSMCGLYTADSNCLVVEVFSELPIKKMSCTEKYDRKKRDIEIPFKLPRLKDGLKELWKRRATNEEFDQFLQSVKDANEQIRLQNFEAFTLDPSDADTTLMSTIKALGRNNPMSIPFVNHEIKVGFATEIEGAEILIAMLEDAVDVYDHADQAFLIGKGLTKKGIQQLGNMLANMTIGDLEALLDLSNIDPIEIQQIINDLIELATELYSETIDAISSGKTSNAFESFDIILRGHYTSPGVSATFFEYTVPLYLGPVVVTLSFGAGCVFGIDAGIGLKVMNMIAEASVTPKGGLKVYGGLGLCFGPLCAELRLSGYIMNLKFPTKAEVQFSKFPLDVGLRMDMHLVPLRLVLAGMVKLRITIPFCCSFSKTIWKKNIWSYTSSLIDKAPLFHLTTKDKDPDPPEFKPLIDDGTQDRSVAQRHCEVVQLKGLDYTEPAFQIAVAASDSLSQIRYFLDIGTIPGGNDILDEEKLGGALTKVSKVLTPTGVPLYFTMFAQNSQGSRSSVTCEILTYDVTLPSGRFEADFDTTSNPELLKAYVVVHDDSPIVEAYLGIGYGEWIYGDQIKRFTPVSLEKRDVDLDIGGDPHNLRALGHFTGMKNGRLIGETISSTAGVLTAGSCAKKCLDLPAYSCLSINYDYGTSGLCQLMKSIEGHDYIIAQDGLFSYYERLGTGHAIEFNENGLNLEHNFLYEFNLDITNSLGYRHIITTKGILTDFTTPEPGLIKNAKKDILEVIPCLHLIPEDRPDWTKYCIGVDTSIRNHRVIVDGEGSHTVFNGRESMTDMQYTRINNYISASWDGFRDNETSIRGYTFAVGHAVCEDLIHQHHDPHRHLLSEEHWDNRGQIYPIPPPYTNLPDGHYFVTVRALNKVMFGGPLSITVCHTTPYIVDTSAPFVHEIYNLRYDERSFFIYGEINISDPHSGIAEYDICFGKTSRSCDLLPWFKYNYISTTTKIEHRYKLPDGVPVWVRIRAVNKVFLSSVGVADQAIVVDSTGPFAGKVYDGPYFKTDLEFSKDNDMICLNWLDFYDPESGISKYMVGVGTQPGLIDVVRLTKQSSKQHSACLLLDDGNVLEHGKTYYGIVWAFNGAIVQRNASAVSNGVLIDLSPSMSGIVVDGRLDNLVDLAFSASKSSVELQWDGFSDPESGIKEYDVKVTKQNGADWETLKDWTVLPNTDKYASWNNFHHQHEDLIKTSLRVRNGALNDIMLDTNGILVDLTAPVMIYLYDGRDAGSDLDFQSDGTQVSCVFEFYDHESGIESFKFQVHEKKNGQQRKIWPDVDKWDNYIGTATQTYQKTGLQLATGAIYTVRVGVSNNAGVLAIHETNGVKLDLTKPKIKWLHVGVFSGENEDLHNGYAYQTDHKGIKLSLLVVDPESGVLKIKIRVGTSPGSGDIKEDIDYSGTLQDVYVTGITLHDTDTSSAVFEPVYYVTIVAYNGAGERSVESISNPIAVLPEDVPGIIYDGIHSSQEFGDVDYDSDSSSVSVSFSGFQSTLHGISTFVWAVGTAPGLENIQPFTENGIIRSEPNDNENGMSRSNIAQMPLYLKHGETYFSTVRGVTNGGNVLESASDGFLIDLTPGAIVFDSIMDDDERITEAQTPLYVSHLNQFNYEWHYFDDQYKTAGVLDNIDDTWLSIGTVPLGENIKNLTEQPVTPTHVGYQSAANIDGSNKGLPYILNVYAKNKAGFTSVKSATSVVVDSSAPTAGIVTCLDFIQPQGELKCTWTPFYDSESQLAQYSFSLGTDEGRSDLISQEVIPANSTWFHTDVSKLLLSHDMVLYATVTAINSVNLETYQFSNKITVDSSPPLPGVVVELTQEHIFDGNGDMIRNNFTCQTTAECQSLDIVCQESLVSVAIAWQAFLDEQSGVSNYQMAVGTTEGGVEIQDFITLESLTEPFTYILSGINLFGARQVFVKIKAINGAGLSTIATSNGVYISYLSQGLSPLLPIGIWDADSVLLGDINYQTDTSTIGAAWDVYGEPCPAIKFEWAVERLDGYIIQDFIPVSGNGIESNDQQKFQHGETYYSLLKVTNAQGYQYVLRSDGVTIHNHPLAPGSVYDGDILGYDLTILDSKSTVTCNWNHFGVAISEAVESVLTGNLGNRDIEALENQYVSYYEVGLGSDRRYSDTKDDVVAFRNVGNQSFVTFTGLDLIPGNAVYYCTVRAYSATHSTASVTSNGFSVSFEGGVSAREILMQRFITSVTEMSVQWDSFESKVDMMLYYVAVSDSDIAKLADCKHYVDSPDAVEDENSNIFNVQNVKNVALNSHVILNDLRLNHGQTYYVYVIGVDFSGECNMTVAATTVDLTPPGGGHVTAGPYYNMKLAFTSHFDSISVKWEDYEDLESDIESYELSLWVASSCGDLQSLHQIGEPVKIGHAVRNYIFRDLEMSENKPYIIKMKIINEARLITEAETSPVLFDDSKPLAGKVVEGTNYKDDVVFWGATDYVQGTLLHFPSSSGLACPWRSVSFKNDPFWTSLEMPGFQQPDGRKWKMHYVPAHARVQATTDNLEIKMSRDTKQKQMLSGGTIRSADMENGGVYEIKVKAAGGNGLAVTEIMFLDAALQDFHTYNHAEEPDWTVDLCSCCLENSATNGCPCTNCEAYLESLHERVTEVPTTNEVTSKTSTAFPSTVRTKEEGRIVEVEKDTSFVGYKASERKVKQKGCGLQIMDGEAPFVIAWCRFYNDTSRDMEIRTELQFDPAESFHSYKMVFSILKEELLESWELELYIDDLKIQKFSGIPQLSNSTQFVLHVWNRDNYVPELSDVFDNWAVKAVFKELVFPPNIGELCRYGEVFQSGKNPIVRYEAGIGSQIGITDIQPFSEVLTTCIPCSDKCSILHCVPLCDVFTEQLTFRLENLNLSSKLVNGNESEIATYYLAVKAVLSSGENAVSYSDGFYIDTTPPTFDTQLFMYIDVDQSDFTPVEYQGCNHTIKSLWLCDDEESEIQGYEWAIGLTIGATDIQEFLSTGSSPSGINNKLEGVLGHKSRYFISIKCTNEAGLTTMFKDEKGVEILLEAPDADDMNGQIVGAESFDTEVDPPDSQKSDDHGTIGGSWEVMKDASVTRYDFCVGSSEKKLEDICPCVWVGYNDSGSVEIRNGYLMYAGQQMYSLKEIGQKAMNGSEPGKFQMETGRVLFPSIRLCNKAVRCSKKSLGTVTITSELSDIKTSDKGSTLVFTVNQKRTKRDTGGEDIVVETPSDSHPGQTVIVSVLTDEELQLDYGSDASNEFVPYISNPNITFQSVERLLAGRIQVFLSSFSIVSVGQLPMTGPIIVSFPQFSEDPTKDDENITILVHWNPDVQKWQISSRTCINEPDTLIYRTETQRTDAKICDTRAASVGSYFYAETQFALVIAKASPVNNAPVLQAVPVLTMQEDEGTLLLQLVANDPDGDDVEFFLLSSVNDFPSVASEMELEKNGRFTFTPCQTCFGTLKNIQIVIKDTPQALEIQPLSTIEYITIEVRSVNNAPVVFLLNEDGDLLLHPDPTDDIMIFLENRAGEQEEFSVLVGAYDLDTNDELTISQRISSNGTFSLTNIDPADRDSYFVCNTTWCLNTVPDIDPYKMAWVLARISYLQDTTYSGMDSIQIVVQDSHGTYSDPVTLKIIMMEMPCLHRGECLATGGGLPYTCSDVRRTYDFFDNYACVCPSGWSGHRCEQDVNECDLSPCGGPYACHNIMGSYECQLAAFAIILIVLSVGVFLAILVVLFLCRHKLRALVRPGKNFYKPWSKRRRTNQKNVISQTPEGIELAYVNPQANTLAASGVVEDKVKTNRRGKNPLSDCQNPPRVYPLYSDTDQDDSSMFDFNVYSNNDDMNITDVPYRRPDSAISESSTLSVKAFPIPEIIEMTSVNPPANTLDANDIVEAKEKLKERGKTPLSDYWKPPRVYPLYSDADQDDTSVFDFTVDKRRITTNRSLTPSDIADNGTIYDSEIELHTSGQFWSGKEWPNLRPISALSKASASSVMTLPNSTISVDDDDIELGQDERQNKAEYVEEIKMEPEKDSYDGTEEGNLCSRPNSVMSVTSALSEVILPNLTIPVDEDDTELCQEVRQNKAEFVELYMENGEEKQD